MSVTSDLAREKYVSLTTFKRDGTPVATPVWLAGDGDAVVVYTGRATGKVKRLRHTPRVTLTPCDARGRTRPGAATVEARADLVEDPAEVKRITRLVTGRYPVLGRLLPLVARLRGRTEADAVGIRITG